jgi:hypothetical protein
MRMSPSKRFFNLNEAVQLSRKLSSPARPSGDLGMNAPALAPTLNETRIGLRSNIVDDAVNSVFGAAIPEPLTADATNAMALWQILLSWARDAVGADGAFALERCGFRIAAVGNLAPFPPEIFSEAFASASRLFDVYLSGGMGISGVSLMFESLGRVVLYPLRIDDMSVLIGFSAKGAIQQESVATVCRTITAEVTRFERGMDASLDIPADVPGASPGESGKPAREQEEQSEVMR